MHMPAGVLNARAVQLAQKILRYVTFRCDDYKPFGPSSRGAMKRCVAVATVAVYRPSIGSIR